MKAHRNVEKQLFVIKNFCRDQLELIRMFGINLVLRLNQN